MRFNNHIHESFGLKEWEVLSALLEKDCMPYIKQLKGAKNLLWRGVSDVALFYKKKSQRQDRKPLLVDKYLHTLLDEWTDKNWGFKARSQASFTSSYRENTRRWGNSFLFFPIGDFRYAWNKDVTKVYQAYDGFTIGADLNKAYYNRDKGLFQKDMTIEKSMEEVFDRTVLPNLKNYSTSNLSKYLKMSFSGNDLTECIVHCKSYYIIHDSWDKTLLRWFSDKYWKKG